MLILCLSLTAQNFSNQSLQKSLKLYTQLKAKAVQQIEHDNLKDKRDQKSIILNESYYSLEYNDTTQRWDTVYRVSWYGDTINNQLKQMAIGETYTPQGFYKSDSAYFYLDTTYKYYKVYGKSIILDSARVFLFDTTSNSWILFVEEFNLPNANGDLDISYTNFGPLFTDSIIYSYDASNNLTHFVTWGSDFFTQTFGKRDSTVCESNLNGYRALDSVYTTDTSQQWQFNRERRYEYDNRNNLTRETSSFSRYAYVYDINDELIEDTVYRYTSSPNPGFEIDYYTIYEDDSTTEFRLNGTIPEIQRVERYYSTHNRPDSTVRLFRPFNSSQLTFSDKDIFIYSLTNLKEVNRSGLNFHTYPNPAKHELYVEFPKDRFEVLLYDLNGVERFRSMEKGNFKIDVSNFSKGIYFLRIDNSVKKIIIQ